MFEMSQIDASQRSSFIRQLSIQDQLQSLVQILSTSISAQCASMISHIQKQLSDFSNYHKETIAKEQEKYKAKYLDLQNQLEERRRNNQRYAINYAMNADQIQKLLEKKRLLERELQDTRRQLQEQRISKLDISRIPSRSNISYSNELPNPEDSLSLTHRSIYNCEDEFHVMRNIVKMKKLKSEGEGEGNQSIDEFEWEPEKIFSIGHKKLAYEIQLTKEGILFTNIVPDIKWSKFIIYKSLFQKKEKKFIFKLHQLRSTNFIIGIGLKTDLVKSQVGNRGQRERVLAFQPYAGKMKKYDSIKKNLRLLNQEQPISEMLVRLREKRIIWQESDTNILHQEAIPQEMIRKDLVVYFELHRGEEKVELLLEQFQQWK